MCLDPNRTIGGTMYPPAVLDAGFDSSTECRANHIRTASGQLFGSLLHGVVDHGVVDHGVVDHGVVHYGPIGLLAAIEQYACSGRQRPRLGRLGRQLRLR